MIAVFCRKWLFSAILVWLLSFFAESGLLAVHSQQKTVGESAAENKHGLVILLEFPDVALPLNKDMVRDRFNKLDFYVREMSYGKVGTSVDIVGWYRLPQSIKSYAISPANLEVDKSRVVKLIQDAIDAADSSNDFSRYSYVVLFLGAQFREYGMVGLCGYPGMLGWHQDMQFRTKNGQLVPGGVAIFTAQAHLGTLFHDVAHVWGGVSDGKRAVPCLYDHDIQARHPTQDSGFAAALINMGYWDPMSCHFYKRQLPPPGISSWTKIRLGWLGPEKIQLVDPSLSCEVVLGPLEDATATTLAVKIPLTESTYYLIENRQPIGIFDSHLPGKGVLILYVDERVAECRQGRSPVKLMNAKPEVPYLQGAAYDLPASPRFIDKKNNLEIMLVEKIGNAYKLRIAPIQ